MQEMKGTTDVGSLTACRFVDTAVPSVSSDQTVGVEEARRFSNA